MGSGWLTQYIGILSSVSARCYGVVLENRHGLPTCPTTLESLQRKFALAAITPRSVGVHGVGWMGEAGRTRNLSSDREGARAFQNRQPQPRGACGFGISDVTKAQRSNFTPDSAGPAGGNGRCTNDAQRGRLAHAGENLSPLTKPHLSLRENPEGHKERLVP